MGQKKWFCDIRIGRFYIVMAISIMLLGLGMITALTIGAKQFSLPIVWEALWHFNESNIDHQILQFIRFPRVLAAALVGAAFAVAGALMQGVTRNPLADSGILGINAGATFVVAISFVFLPGLSFSTLMLLSFVGAACTTIFIFGLGASSPGGLTPLKLTLAGTVVASLLHSVTSGIAIYFELSQDLAFWYAGGVAGVEWPQLKLVAPIILTVLVLSCFLGRPISLMAMGEEIAVNLGIKTKQIRLIAMVFAVILAGVSVSAVGSIAFVGLVIPHIARKLVGVDYRFVIPLSAVLGAVLLVLADLGARALDPPKELAIGVVVAMIGVPFFLAVARKEKRSL